jgi:uncharacterized protein YndB with AHSA1/START domain
MASPLIAARKNFITDVLNRDLRSLLSRSDTTSLTTRDNQHQSENAMRTIQRSEKINASPREMYEMLTAADQLSRWFPTRSESDPRVGGDYTFTFESKAHPEMNHIRRGTFTELDPGRLVRYNWEVENTDVTFTIAPDGDGSIVSLEHAGWSDDAASDTNVEMHTNGWGFFLQNLKSVAETGVDQRAGMWS